jgi:hypothetical protein
MLAVKYNKIDNRKNKLRNADVGVTEAKVRMIKWKILEIFSKGGSVRCGIQSVWVHLFKRSGR